MTEAAIVDFQRNRGLDPHGRCDTDTWAVLVEASWALGDRLLYHTSPNLRGDDVAEVQSLLTRLGFDCGRVDGIYGPRTVAAVADFQRNCGLDDDGACGRATVAALRQLSRHTGTGPGVALLHEHERLRSSERRLEGRRIVIGQFGGLSALARATTRQLRAIGAQVVTIDEPDARVQAASANRFDADLYLGLEATASPTITLSYYSVPTFTSTGGRTFARLLRERLEEDVAGWSELTPRRIQIDTIGMRRPILRETRMPAVLATLGPVRQVVDHAPMVSSALARAVKAWCEHPVDETGALPRPRLDDA